MQRIILILLIFLSFSLTSCASNKYSQQQNFEDSNIQITKTSSQSQSGKKEIISTKKVTTSRLTTTSPPVTSAPQATKTDKTTTPQETAIPDNNYSDSKVVYLTFDDGPSYITPKILDILDTYNVKATFFVTGINPEYYSYIKTANDKGHTIGLHTFCHDYQKIYSSEYEYFSDLQKISDLCEEQIGFKPKYIRFPGGSSNTISSNYKTGIMSNLVKETENKGYLYFDWNCTSGDGGGDLSVQDLIKNAELGACYDKVVILCHDANGKETTVEALPEIIAFYKSKGYNFRPIDNNAFVAHHNVFN